MESEDGGGGQGGDRWSLGLWLKINRFLLPLLVQVECNSKLDPTKTTLLKVQAPPGGLARALQNSWVFCKH